MEYYTQLPSPAGHLLLTAEGAFLTGIWMDREPSPESIRQDTWPVLVQAAAWLKDYFRGIDRTWDFPLELRGTAFQKQVWQILLTIPYGETRSYGQIAQKMAIRLGKAKMSAQAVGNAVSHNPISILVPCHRVVGSQGQLTGYAGGLDRKIILLEHEGWVIKSGKICRC